MNLLIRKLKKSYRKILSILYGFDNWHISTLSERPYAIDVIAYCNSRAKKQVFGEIGCGLGDIVRNVYFSQRYGFDMEKGVLAAARMLPVKGDRKTLKFEHYVFPKSTLSIKFDVLLLVNWTHNIDPVILQSELKRFYEFNLLDHGEIIIDTVQDPTYLYNHKIDILSSGLNCDIKRIGEYSRQREVWSITKNN